MKPRGLELLRVFSQQHGAPGAEGDVRRMIKAELGQVQCDRFGNVWAEHCGTASAPRVMLTAHMDEVGFAVQSITAGGLLRIVPTGSWWTHTLLAQRVRVRTRRGTDILGVVTSKPPHFLSDAERDRLQKIEDLYIDVGARDARQAREEFGVDLGDSIVPDTPFTPMANPDMLLSKAFDDRAGLAAAVHAYELLRQRNHPNTIVFTGTVQEEVGTRGAQTAAVSVQPDVALVIEGTPADDFPGMPADERQGAVGAGVQIRLLDPTAFMNTALRRMAIDVARELEIPCQVAVRRSGGTDARAIHMHGAGVPAIVLGVPSRYVHTHNTILHLDDYAATVQLAVALAEKLDAVTVAELTNYLGD